jgi:high affinity Mn2+ porin
MPASVPAATPASRPAAMPARALAAATSAVAEPAKRASWWREHLLNATRWNVNFQSTLVWQMHPGFHADYDGPNSLVSTSETGYTLTATLFLGYRPWRGAEIFANPEMIQSLDLSHLHGLGGLSNAENQRGGGLTAKLYSARAFLRQTFRVGGESATVEAGPNQFPSQAASRRFVLTVGQMGLIDIFDNNAFAHDGRTQFLNWALLAHGASDFAADARGYTWGLALEYYHDDWAFRVGRFAQPIHSNGIAIDFKLWAHYGDNLEVEHGHRLWSRAGKVRLYGFRNYAKMGGFRDAVDHAQRNGGTPDLASVRRDRAKYGLGIALEQYLTRDLGLFGRFSWNDGRTETYAFAEIEMSATVGLSMKGRLWRRPDDTVGFAFVQNGLSHDHRDFLAAGGLGIFLGDGRINYQAERILEAYYSFRAFKGLWLSLGWQYVWDPAYNADRGPVSLYSCRGHVEF